MSSDLPTPVRRYGDKEVRRLLQRAAEIQKQESVREYADDGGGLTLADLQEVAAEAGIHPKYIQQAAAGIEQSKPSGFASKLAGTELTITVERVVPGELPEEGFEQAILEIQRAFSGSGNPSMVGRTLMWKSDTMDQHSLRCWYL
jgi:exoribonuclease R